MVTSLILGFLSPGYDNLRHTISRLLILKYAWVAKLNFLQFAAGIYAFGIIISENMIHKKSQLLVKKVMAFCALTLALIAFSPPHHIDNFMINYSALSPSAIVHIGLVFGFVIVSPIGINFIAKTFASEPTYKSLVKQTQAVGYGAFFLSLTWFLVYWTGVFWDYKGLFQKLLATLVISWLEILLLQPKEKKVAPEKVNNL